MPTRNVLITLGRTPGHGAEQSAQLTVVDAETNQTYVRVFLTAEQVANIVMGDFRVPVTDALVEGPKQHHADIHS